MVWLKIQNDSQRECCLKKCKVRFLVRQCDLLKQIARIAGKKNSAASRRRVCERYSDSLERHGHLLRRLVFPCPERVSDPGNTEKENHPTNITQKCANGYWEWCGSDDRYYSTNDEQYSCPTGQDACAHRGKTKQDGTYSPSQIDDNEDHNQRGWSLFRS